MPRSNPRDAWLVQYLNVQARYEPQIERLLNQAAQDAARAVRALAGKPGIGAEVRGAQLLQSQSALMRALSRFWRALENTVRAGQADAQVAALEASFDWDDVLLERTHPNPDERAAMRRYLVASAERNVEAMLARVFGGGRRPLSQQVYRTEALTQGWLERRINSALARGASTTELARDVQEFVRPRVPGGVAYAAKRLARTEINNAYHAQSIAINDDKPWNQGMQWNLSRSHPEPDQCDLLARQNQHNLGRGVYPLGQVPPKPHPQCLCFVVPKTVTPAQFERQLLAGAYDSWISDHLGPDSAGGARTVA